MDKENFFYNYCHGPVAEIIYSEEAYKATNELILEHLILSNFRNIRTAKVLCFGTGKEAIAFSRIGALHVDNIDISGSNVSMFSEHLKKNFSRLKIKAKKMDIVMDPLPPFTYDFVYMNGVVQHLSNPGAGLANVSHSIKLGGKIWVYFYRSGTFKWFVISMIRDLVSKDEIDEYYLASQILYSNGDNHSFFG